MAAAKPRIQAITTTDPNAAAKPKKSINQLPGMSSHDIDDAANEFDEICDTLALFSDAMALVTGFGHNYNTSREKLLRLAAHLKIDDLQIGDPIVKEFPTQPES